MIVYLKDLGKKKSDGIPEIIAVKVEYSTTVQDTYFIFYNLDKASELGNGKNSEKSNEFAINRVLQIIVVTMDYEKKLYGLAFAVNLDKIGSHHSSKCMIEI